MDRNKILEVLRIKQKRDHKKGYGASFPFGFEAFNKTAFLQDQDEDDPCSPFVYSGMFLYLQSQTYNARYAC